MSIVNGYVDWAKKVDGAPKDKVYSVANTGRNGIVCHSVEGFLGASDKIDRVFNTSKTSDGRYTNYAAMSVIFLLKMDGTLVQYYPVTASCWTSGNRTANTTTWAVEAEGNLHKPLTPEQVQAMLRLAGEWEAYTGRKMTRGGGGANYAFGTNVNVVFPADRTLWNHHEATQFDTINAGATACPSARYDEFFMRVAQESEDPMNKQAEELLLLLATVIAGPVNGKDFTTLEDAINAVKPVVTPGDQLVIEGLRQVNERVGSIEGVLGRLAGALTPEK